MKQYEQPNFGEHVRNGLVIALLLLLVQSTTAQPKERLQVGDSWTFSVNNVRNGVRTESESTRTVSAVSDQLRVIDITSRTRTGESVSRETRDPNLNLLESGNFRYVPNLDLFRFPLAVGKRTYDVRREEIDSGRLIGMVGEVEVMPLKAVLTPAGEFEAYEVIANGRFVDPKTGQSSRYQTRAWYAPAAKFYVKQAFHERNIADTAIFTETTFELKAIRLVP